MNLQMDDKSSSLGVLTLDPSINSFDHCTYHDTFDSPSTVGGDGEYSETQQRSSFSRHPSTAPMKSALLSTDSAAKFHYPAIADSLQATLNLSLQLQQHDSNSKSHLSQQKDTRYLGLERVDIMAQNSTQQPISEPTIKESAPSAMSLPHSPSM